MYDLGRGRAEGDGLAPGERYRLGSLGDLLEMLVDGWRIEHMHYADRCPAGGPSGVSAGYFDLARAGDERAGVYVPEDGRAYSHRSLVALFRESPHIWKHRSGDAIPAELAASATPPEDWGEVPRPFPEALHLTPGSLRQVIAVNQIQSVDGLDVALVALERHLGGARVRYMCHASDVRTRREMSVLDVVAVDDGGRRYAVASVASRTEGNRLDGELVLAPAIPQEATRLTVAVGSLGPGDRAGGPPAWGPWVFPIALAGPG